MSNIGGTKCEVGLMLYKACVRTHPEMTYLLWCTAGLNIICKLKSVHWQALERALGTISGTPMAILKVLSGIPPLQLWLVKILHVMPKPEDDP